jgi:hypothetical protein
MNSGKLRATWDYWRQMWVTKGGFLLNCHECRKLVSMPSWGLAWCPEHEPHWSRRHKITKPAHVAVARAIRHGELPHPSTLKCVDCGSPAQVYDHRDYDKPLQVEPVCRGCNCRRGPAKQLDHLKRADWWRTRRENARDIEQLTGRRA